MNRNAVAFLLVGAIAAIAGHGLRAQEVISLKPGTDFKEDLRPEAVISSGGRVVGIVGDAERSEHFPELGVAIPSEWRGGDICIGVASADGLYESSGTFTVPKDLDSAIAPVEYPETEYTDELEGIERSRMGVLVSSGACGTGKAIYAIAFWSAVPDELPKEFRILVNSFRADRVELYTGSGKRFVCERLSGAGQTAYDAECVVPLEALAGHDSEIEIVTVQGTTVDPLPIMQVQLDRK